METKKCNKCNLDKPVTEYYKDKSKKDGLTTFCIECKSQSNKISHQKNIEKRLVKAKEYREKNKDKIKERDKKYYQNNKQNYSEKAKLYRELNSDKIKENAKIYYQENKDKIMERYFDNRETELIRMKNWKKENREKLAEYQRKYYNERRKNNPLFKLQLNIRSLIRLSIKNKGLKKKSKTQQILGCSFEDFKNHLESKFEPWMNWDNYGLYNGEPNYGWDIDHIIPSSSALNEEELLKLNHFSNLQPLCSYINRDVKIDNY